MFLFDMQFISRDNIIYVSVLKTLLGMPKILRTDTKNLKYFAV